MQQNNTTNATTILLMYMIWCFTPRKIRCSLIWNARLLMFLNFDIHLSLLSKYLSFSQVRKKNNLNLSFGENNFSANKYVFLGCSPKKSFFEITYIPWAEEIRIIIARLRDSRLHRSGSKIHLHKMAKI